MCGSKTTSLNYCFGALDLERVIKMYFFKNWILTQEKDKKKKKAKFKILRLFRTTPKAYQARGQIRAVAASLCHSHSGARSMPRLQPTSQLSVMLDPLPTEQYWGLNLCSMDTSQIHFH